MAKQTTGQRAINLLREMGFRATSSGPLPDGTSYALMVDIEGRGMEVRIDAKGALTWSTPMRPWAAEVDEAYGMTWPEAFRATTVEELTEMLERMGLTAEGDR